MSATRLAWTRGTWLNPPLSATEHGEHMIVEAAPGSDFWEKTLYGFQHDSGHALLAVWDGEHAVEVSFELSGFTDLYDQAGLMLVQSGTRWIKAGIEINDGVPHLSAVVTDDFSDWSLAPVPDWTGRTITLRASRLQDAVVLRACATGVPWRTLRVARFPNAAHEQAGPFTCAPKRAGLQVTFTGWRHTEPDADLHRDPPLP